ncbi:hypothetical protein DFH27DRAFT_599789 [Peziza echinospora]|nr:hypothetical protein DFH27DRAFT_599789 [Peziza echinospora]
MDVLSRLLLSGFTIASNAIYLSVVTIYIALIMVLFVIIMNSSAILLRHISTLTHLISSSSAGAAILSFLRTLYDRVAFWDGEFGRGRGRQRVPVRRPRPRR